MIETKGLFLQRSKTLRFLCPLCGELETRAASIPIKPGAMLRTKCTCSGGKRDILVTVEKVVSP